MARPVFVFDRDGWMDIEDERVPPDQYLEWIDLCAGEYTAFDIDGQLLDLVLRVDEVVLSSTGSYDLPRLVALAMRGAELEGHEWTGEDPLLELANRDLMNRYEWNHRPRGFLGRLLRRRDDATPPPTPYTR